MRLPCLVLLATLIFCAARPATAATGVTLLPTQGTPDTVVAVTGSGFGANEAVDVYVDLTDTLLLVSSSSGSISGSVTVPVSASPGTHDITAIGRKSGDTVQAAFVVTTPWAEFGYGSAHLGDNPWENSISAFNVGSLGTAWIHTESVGASGATPAVTGGTVYASLEGGIEALSAATGAALWKSYSTAIFYGSPTVVGGVVYIAGGTSSAVYALNATTGAKIWGTVLGSDSVSSAVVAGGLVYVGCDDTKVYALSAATGKIAWTYATGAYIDGSPTVVNGVLYIGSTDSRFYALNAATGALIWSYTTGKEVESTPAVVSGVAYIGSDDGSVYAFETQGAGPGTKLWSFATGAQVYAAPVVANGVVYVGAANGVMYALNAHTGAELWSVTTGGLVRGSAVANGILYFTSQDNTLYVVNATYGTILTTFVTGGSFFGGPAVSDGVVYLNAFGGSTYAFSLGANTDPMVRRGPPVPSSLHPDLRLEMTR